jgi:hypothetical protein
VGSGGIRRFTDSGFNPPRRTNIQGIGRLVNWSIGQLVDWWGIGVDWLIGQLVDWWGIGVDWLIGQLVDWWGIGVMDSKIPDSRIWDLNNRTLEQLK